MSSSISRQRRGWLSAYAPLVVWASVILMLGSGLGAMNETSRFIRPFLEFLFPNAAPETLSILHGYIRKSAHLFEYAILAMIAARAFNHLRHRYVLSISIVLLVATVDEFNQSFNTSRTGTPFDVLIDLAGGLLGLAVYWLFGKVLGRSTKTSSGPLG